MALPPGLECPNGFLRPVAGGAPRNPYADNMPVRRQPGHGQKQAANIAHSRRKHSWSPSVNLEGQGEGRLRQQSRPPFRGRYLRLVLQHSRKAGKLQAPRNTQEGSICCSSYGPDSACLKHYCSFCSKPGTLNLLQLFEKTCQQINK